MGRRPPVSAASPGTHPLGQTDMYSMPLMDLGHLEPRRLSFDHKPSVPSEIQRVQALGGFCEKGRLMGTLSLTRALGDIFLHPFVSADPHITVSYLDTRDRILIMACDGLWDVLSDEDAVEVASQSNTPADAAMRLRDRAFSLSSGDNISVVCVLLDVRN
ncbi:protein phosphatase 2C family [Kipferlia bialata]|uniref:Protein phosphatase 2C family n=1 Tax=Kipferlia bialata TaxID=797122 RepID=A0A9K3GN44_9EUKA|nr:protein phosphatase 2C family [Kipferlia bialata]|eukprot:g12577.t1